MPYYAGDWQRFRMRGRLAVGDPGLFSWVKKALRRIDLGKLTRFAAKNPIMSAAASLIPGASSITNLLGSAREAVRGSPLLAATHEALIGAVQPFNLFGGPASVGASMAEQMAQFGGDEGVAGTPGMVAAVGHARRRAGGRRRAYGRRYYRRRRRY